MCGVGTFVVRYIGNKDCLHAIYMQRLQSDYGKILGTVGFFRHADVRETGRQHCQSSFLALCYACVVAEALKASQSVPAHEPPLHRFLVPLRSAMCRCAGYVQSIIDFLKTLPGIRGLVEREHSKMMVASFIAQGAL